MERQRQLLNIEVRRQVARGRMPVAVSLKPDLSFLAFLQIAAASTV